MLISRLIAIAVLLLVTVIDSPTGLAAEKQSHVNIQGHTAAIRALAETPDSRYLISIGNGLIKHWDIKTRQEVRTLIAYWPEAQHYALSSDARWLAMSQDNEVIVQNTDSGELVHRMRLEGHEIYDIYFSDNDKWLVSSGTGIVLWSVSSGRLLKHYLKDQKIESSALSPDGRYLAYVIRAGSYGTQSFILMLSTSTDEVRQVADIDCYYSQLRFSSDGAILAIWIHYFGASGMYGWFEVNLWDINNFHEIATTEEIETEGMSFDPWDLNSLQFSPDGKMLFTDIGNTVVLLDSKTAQQYSDLGKVTTASRFSHDSRILYYGTDSGMIIARNIKSGEEVGFAGRDLRISDIAISPTGQYIASGYGSFINLWDPKTGSLANILNNQENNANFIQFTPDKDRLIVDNGNAVSVWNVSNKKLVKQFSIDSHEILFDTYISFLGNVIAYSGGYNYLSSWNIESGQKIRDYDKNDHSALFRWRGPVVVSPDGKLLVASDGSNIAIYKVQSGQRIKVQGDCMKKR